MEEIVGMNLMEMEGRGKAAVQTRATEVMMDVGQERGGGSGNELTKRFGRDPANVTRGYERAGKRLRTDEEVRLLIGRVSAD